MDGNGRWAKKHSLKKKKGHEAGIETAIKLCKSISKESLIKNITLYTFSTENWKRPLFEINQLFDLINNVYIKFKDTANKEDIRIIHLGKKNGIPKKTLDIINDVVTSTKDNNGW